LEVILDTLTGVFLFGVKQLAKEYAKKFYNSKAWQVCRQSFIAKRVTVDGAMCEHCGDVPGYIVDHIKEITPNNIDDPNVTLSHDNLQYLCLECHNVKTFSTGSSVRKDIGFDEQGNVIHVSPPLNNG
jgi:5-methylcytosine-specific restriction endonuclease McrA